jgi:hypothetical protein
MTEEAGFGSVRVVPAPLASTLHFVAGRRRQRRAPTQATP